MKKLVLSQTQLLGVHNKDFWANLFGLIEELRSVLLHAFSKIFDCQRT